MNPFYFDRVAEANRSEHVTNYNFSPGLTNPPKYELEDHMPSTATSENVALYHNTSWSFNDPTLPKSDWGSTEYEVSTASIRGNKDLSKVPKYVHKSVNPIKRPVFKVNWEHYGNVRAEAPHGNKKMVEDVARVMTFKPNKLSIEESNARVKGRERFGNKFIGSINSNVNPLNTPAATPMSYEHNINGSLVETPGAYISAS